MDPAPGVLSLLPPLLAIGLALFTREVYLSLAAGILSGYVILAGGDPFGGAVGAVDAVVGVFESAGNTRIILFTLVIGALIALIQRGGGVTGFVARVLAELDRAASQADARGQRRRVELLAVLTGLVLFVESNISILTVGTLFRPLTDRLGVPREKLAYIADTGSAPSNVLIPFNAWGAYLAGLLATEGVAGGFGVVLASVPFNLYALGSFALLVWVVASGRDFGPMRAAESRGTLLRAGAVPAIGEEFDAVASAPGAPPRARNMLLPIAAMVFAVPVWLWWTGEGEGLARLQSGSGSRAVLYAVSGAVLLAMLLFKAQRLFSVREGVEVALRGMKAMLPLALLMVLAFAIGDVARALGTGAYVADLAAPLLSPSLLPALLFVVGAFVAFSTGTSWGTFAILIPIAVPLASTLGSPLPVALAACVGGGVFGDHSSPISDTSLVSSMAAGSDHIDHVRTQLPYALAAGTVAVVGYGVLGVVL